MRFDRLILIELDDHARLERGPQLVKKPLFGIPELREREANLVGSALFAPERRRVDVRLREVELEHADELLPLALDLLARRRRPHSEHVERILHDPLSPFAAHRTLEP